MMSRYRDFNNSNLNQTETPMSQQNFYYFSDYFGQSNESNALDRN